MEYYGLDARPDPDDIATMYPERKFLKTKYRELVRVHHPDKQGDTAEFQRIDAAYRELLGLYEEENKGGKFKYPTSGKKKSSSSSAGRGAGTSSSPTYKPGDVPDGFDPFGGSSSGPNAQAYTFDPFTGEQIPVTPPPPGRGETDNSSSGEEENGGPPPGAPGSTSPDGSTAFHVVEIIVMGFRNVEKTGSYRIEVALDGRSQTQRDWTKITNRGVFHCGRVENFTFFRWNPKSYIQVILHGQRKFRLDKRAGEAHIPVVALMSAEHNGSYDGWVMVEHKGKHRGEILLAIHMDGPEIQKKSERPPSVNPFAENYVAIGYGQPPRPQHLQAAGTTSGAQLDNGRDPPGTNPFAVAAFDPFRGGGGSRPARESSSLPGSPAPRAAAASNSPGMQPRSPQPTRGNYPGGPGDPMGSYPYEPPPGSRPPIRGGGQENGVFYQTR